MNQNIKYTICFLLGIIISHLLFNNNIEGLCPGEESASGIDDCSNASSTNCANFYSGSGASARSCYLLNGSCSASSVVCTPVEPPIVLNRCHSNFPSPSDDTYSIITGSNYSNYDFNSLLTSLSENCVSTSEDVISCSGTINTSGTINCSGSDSDTGRIICNDSIEWELSGCMPSSPPPPPPSTPPSSSSSSTPPPPPPPSSLTCSTISSDICDNPEEYKSTNNCSGSSCTEEECCEKDYSLYIYISIGVCVLCCILVIISIFFFGSKTGQVKQYKRELKNSNLQDKLDRAHELSMLDKAKTPDE